MLHLRVYLCGACVCARVYIYILCVCVYVYSEIRLRGSMVVR